LGYVSEGTPMILDFFFAGRSASEVSRDFGAAIVMAFSGIEAKLTASSLVCDQGHFFRPDDKIIALSVFLGYPLHLKMLTRF